jgi:hypothetical protein
MAAAVTYRAARKDLVNKLLTSYGHRRRLVMRLPG